MNPNPFDPLSVRPDTEQHDKVRQVYKKIAEIRLTPGLRLFMLNTETVEVEEVPVESFVKLDVEKNGVVPDHRHKAHYNPKNFYIQALNKKNVERKFLKMIEMIKQLQDERLHRN